MVQRVTSSKKSLWAELEAGLGVTYGFYQNNQDYKLAVNTAMAKYLVSGSVALILKDVNSLTQCQEDLNNA